MVHKDIGGYVVTTMYSEMAAKDIRECNVTIIYSEMAPKDIDGYHPTTM